LGGDRAASFGAVLLVEISLTGGDIANESDKFNNLANERRIYLERIIENLILHAAGIDKLDEKGNVIRDTGDIVAIKACRLLDTRSHDDHWTKCRHPETAHNTVSSYDCTVR
jgi:hypothetical protein